MENVPKHCIDIFKAKFNSYPSVIHVKPKQTQEIIESRLSKNYLVWFYKGETDELLYEFSGVYIMVYYNSKTGIFVLTSASRKESAENIIFDLNR
jgi:hypothetical protein